MRIISKVTQFQKKYFKEKYMKHGATRSYCLFLYLLYILETVELFLLASDREVASPVCLCVGILVGWFLAPSLHEIGHIVFAKTQNFQIQYSKFAFLAFVRNGEKLKVKLANPFAPDETQATPKTGGDMLSRMKMYSIGGLVFGGIEVVFCMLWGLVLFNYAITFLFWGLSIHALYLFLLNIVKVEYPTGKTDAKIVQEMENGTEEGRAILNTSEIYAELYEGKTYAEIDKKYFENIVLREDTSLFYILNICRYKRYAESENYEKAGAILNRLVQASAYYTDAQIEEVAGELYYIHCILGDEERAKEVETRIPNMFSGNTLFGKRLRMAKAVLEGKTYEDNQDGYANEWIGVERFEEKMQNNLQNSLVK